MQLTNEELKIILEWYYSVGNFYSVTQKESSVLFQKIQKHLAECQVQERIKDNNDHPERNYHHG